MPDAIQCGCGDCYYNNNLDNLCVKETVSVSSTGECESMIYCDDYQCAECEHFEICTKQKKERYLKSGESNG